MDILPTKTPGELSEPVGEVVLGAVDPRTLSREEFDNSADKLFHGSEKPFNFSSTFNYKDPSYEEVGDGSWTLGPGFYCTDSIDDAGHYSVIRQGARADHTSKYVSTFLPYQAKMLDLRSRDDPTNNAHVPMEFALKWRERFARFLAEEPVTATGLLADVLNETNHGYLPYLDSVIAAGDLDLRIMLETAPGYHNKTHWARINNSSPGQDLFPRFMMEQGFDGLIYLEGGEGSEMGNAPSYVFYNPAKIGTYESWHAGQNSSPRDFDEAAVLAAARQIVDGSRSEKV